MLNWAPRNSEHEHFVDQNGPALGDQKPTSLGHHDEPETLPVAPSRTEVEFAAYFTDEAMIWIMSVWGTSFQCRKYDELGSTKTPGQDY